jgi:hypothetical protein
VNVEAKKQSKQWMHTRSLNKPKKFKQKADGNCFLGQERNSDDGIHARVGHNNVRSVLRNTKKLRKADHSEQKAWNAVVLLHNNARSYTAARTRALLEHFCWELFEHSPYSTFIAPSEYHLFTHIYLKNRLGSQYFNDNEELMESVETWLSSKAADFFDRGIQKLIPRYKCLSAGGDYVQK